MRRRDSARSDLFGDVGIGTLFSRGQFSCGWACSWAGTPRFGYFPSLCICPPALVDAIPYRYREAVWAGASFKYDDKASIGMIFMVGIGFFGRKIGRTATIMHPFLSTFGWIKATPRQLQQPHVIGTQWVLRRGTSDLGFFSLKK
jgi:hypothetical protein